MGPYRSEILLPSARAAKTLQFGHQFHANWSIQSQDTEENHSNEHASYEIPPLTNIFESPIILSLDSLLKKIA